ncbi:MAG: hypothetical protein FP816_12855 [Desulfobacteraceae bacterium]|nr:hypothetical protein [Desulfobacteraceae bacterium]MBU4001045.1 pilus assembly PilX N-terminal domain-containing protein [Pseudomonadota bacterium]
MGNFFDQNEKGIVLIIGLMFIALLSVLAATAYVISTQDSLISANYKYSEQAFNHAEAGVQYGITKLEIALKSGASLPASGTLDIPGASAPSGFLFSLSPLTVEGNNLYSFSSTGKAQKKASSEIKVGLRRLPVVPGGVFGDLNVDSKTHVQYYSYDSRVIPDPTPSDSTGQCDLASNGSIVLNAGTFVDGNVVLGNNRIADASYHPFGAPVVAGKKGYYSGRLEPDPMNINSGDFQAEFDSAALTNDNADITPSIPGREIVHPGCIVNLPGKSGGSIYYLEKIDLSLSDTIMMDATSGPVVLYLRGSFTAKDASGIQILSTGSVEDITIKMTEDPLNPISTHQVFLGLYNSSTLNKFGRPTDFVLITDSDAMLEFKDATEINGLVYAPHSIIFLQSSKPLHGAFMGKSIVCYDHSILYFDTALKDKYLSNDLSIVSWKKVLN